jgi:hypothetical protein
MMKCTAPCFPPCDNEATTVLLSLTGAQLGFNCDKHIAPLRCEKVGNLAAEYNKRPMTDAEKAA